MEEYKNKIIQGNCLDKMREMEDNSVDTIVTDQRLTNINRGCNI